MSHKIVTQIDHGEAIGFIDGKPVIASDRFQLFIDDITQKLNDTLLGNQIILELYTVATLPPIPFQITGLIFVLDESGGPVPAFSDGTNWRRCTDRAIVS